MQNWKEKTLNVLMRRMITYQQGCRQRVGAGGASAPPVFDRSVNPISTRGADYALHSTTSPPGFSDLATALDLLGLLTCWVVVPLILLLWLRSLRLEQATG